jgi:hypothetical protein
MIVDRSRWGFSCNYISSHDVVDKPGDNPMPASRPYYPLCYKYNAYDWVVDGSYYACLR